MFKYSNIKNHIDSNFIHNIDNDKDFWFDFFPHFDDQFFIKINSLNHAFMINYFEIIKIYKSINL
jgi:hypothetical protein